MVRLHGHPAFMRRPQPMFCCLFLSGIHIERSLQIYTNPHHGAAETARYAVAVAFYRIFFFKTTKEPLSINELKAFLHFRNMATILPSADQVFSVVHPIRDLSLTG